jgi:signal transduction histidine kinase
MDTQETGLYHILIITSVVTTGILLYALMTAMLQQLRYRARHNCEVESEILASENERRWIAADMHDDLGPMLSGIKMTLSGIHKENENTLVLLNESIHRIDEISGKIRTLARGLMPPILADKGLVMALQQFIKTLPETGMPNIDLRLQPLPPLSLHASIHIYRIVQEIIHNSIKHAQASQVVIKLYTDDDNLVLSAADNGTGFRDIKKNRQPGGYGLTGIKNRVHMLKGNVKLRSTHGTGYFIQIPLYRVTDKPVPV